ncbi:hypothetical protein P280DRAFT_393554 [Massarina eburnea CBS 473.64]|uniref:Uncharacterized protein n=1 Tax=Massarina eburnea CBS 473.64 TaxID=1395130 RepID=A0A6A6SCR7_9PLEO|nr:hypothetical protein P280DRAFT_393554 [Massarina eburnea CBS 473.64]
MGWFTSTPSTPSRHRSSSHPPYSRAPPSYTSSSPRHHASTSRYKRSPREGYMQYLYHKFRYLLHKLWAYARRHPYKVFFMVIMPLVSGGLLHKLARQFGITLPEVGGAAAAVGRGGYSGGGYGGGGGYRGSSYRGEGGYYGSEGYGGSEGAGGLAGLTGGLSIQSVASGLGGLASLAKMAQSFI